MQAVKIRRRVLASLAARSSATTPAYASRIRLRPSGEASPCLRQLSFNPCLLIRALSLQANLQKSHDGDKGQQTAIPVDVHSADQAPGDLREEVVTFTNARQEKFLITYTGTEISLKNLARHHHVSLYAQKLRDDCDCPQCKDPSSGQKKHSQGQIPPDIRFQRVEGDADGIRVYYHNDIPRSSTAAGQHSQLVTWEFLSAITQRLWHELRLKQRYDRTPAVQFGVDYWDREEISGMVRTIDFDDYMKGGKATEDVVIDLVRYGLVFLRNVPEDPGSVARIAYMIANIQETFYGRTFDVKAKPNAENVAYTSGYLGLHQDLLYLNSPPQIQILHCMENSCPGGESLFCDGDRLGNLMSWSIKHDTLFRPLLETRLRYQYNKNGFSYRQARTVLSRAEDGAFKSLWWSPPFLGTWAGHKGPNAGYFLAARVLEKLIHDETNMYEHKLKPGECVLFDNRRVLHGRRAFDMTAGSGGSRWLRGAYISDEDFNSRAEHLTAGYSQKTSGNAGRTRVEREARLASSKKDTDMLQRIMDEVRSDERNRASLHSSSPSRS